MNTRVSNQWPFAGNVPHFNTRAVGTFFLSSLFHQFSSFLIFYLLQMLSPFCFALSWSLITKQWVNYLSQSSWIYSYALWHSGNYQRLVERQAERFSPHRGAVHIFIMMLCGLTFILCAAKTRLVNPFLILTFMIHMQVLTTGCPRG